MDDEARAQLLKIRLLGGSEDDQANWLVWYNTKGAPEDEPKVGEDDETVFAKLRRAIGKPVSLQEWCRLASPAGTRSTNPVPQAPAPVHQAPEPEVS